MNYQKMCINCACEMSTNDGRCEHCGYEQNSYRPMQHTLRPYTILNGKYLLGKVLGNGGFGITYIAFDMVLERCVAIKEYYVQGSTYRDSSITTEVTVSDTIGSNIDIYQENREKFEKEAKTLASLDKMPGLVGVHDFFYENNTSYIVLEYLSGVTLKNYVKTNGGKLDIKDVIQKLEPVFSSLELLHQKKILHRDISPDNIMVLNDGSVKLFDFGGAKIQTEEEVSRCVLTKAGYSPIEQLQAKGNQGPWTDVYAMAATIYYCISGRVPVDVVSRIADSTVFKRPSEIGATISSEVEKVILKGMEVQFKDRYQSMKEFYDALVGEQDITRQVKRRKGSKVAVVAGALFIVLGVGIMKIASNNTGIDNVLVSEVNSFMEKETNKSETEKIAETEVITETEEVTETEVITETEEVTETEEATENEEIITEVHMPAQKVSVKEGLYVIAASVDNGKLLYADTVSGSYADVRSTEIESVHKQIYRIEEQRNGMYKILANSSGLAITLDKENEKILLTEFNRNINQLWQFEQTEDGRYYIRNNTGNYLEYKKDSKTNTVDLVCVSEPNSECQLWDLYLDGAIDINGNIRTGIYSISSGMDQNKLLTGENNDFEADTDVVVNAKGNLWKQLFYIEKYEEGWYKITSFESGKALTESLGVERNLRQVEYQKEDTQKWMIETAEDGKVYIRSLHGAYIELPEDNVLGETKVVMNEFTGNDNQKWTFGYGGTILRSAEKMSKIETGTYRLVSAMDRRKVLKVSESANNMGSLFVLWSRNELQSETFYVELQSDGTYKIISQISGKALTVKDASSEEKTLLSMEEYTGGAEQKWIIESTDDNYYCIKSLLGTCIDCDYQSTEDGTTVFMYDVNMGSNQKWLFEKVN